MSKPIAGLGRLLPGVHRLEVLSAVITAKGTALILSGPDAHCHAEDLPAPLRWLVPGLRVTATIGHGPGYVVVRDAARGYQARDGLDPTRQLTDWHRDLESLYAVALTATNLIPSTTVLKELTDGTEHWRLPTPDSGAPSAP